jgi:hypothetical protein
VGTSAIAGVVTGRDVLLQAPAIISNFGARTWLRCVLALGRRRPTTFLALVFEDSASR